MKLVGNVHLVAGTDAVVPHILNLLSAEGISLENNPDIYIRSYTSFGVDEAREIRDRARSRSLGERRVFLLSMPFMTHEAQNALLKVLEEAPGNSLLFFVLPTPETLLSTLRSRSQILRFDATVVPNTLPATFSSAPTVTTHPDPKTFLKATPSKRLDMIKPLLEKDDDEKRDMGSIITFLSCLERMLGERQNAEGLDAAHREGLESVYRARRYLGDKGALVKPLLEQVALLVPVL